MALLVFEGFEGAGTTTGDSSAPDMLKYIRSRYPASLWQSTDARIRVVDGWGWGKALSWGGNANADDNFIDMPLGKAVTEAWIGFAIKTRYAQIPSVTVVRWRTSSYNEDHVDMRVIESKHLVFYLDTYTNLGFVPNVFHPDRWSYIEIRVKNGNYPDGEIEVRVNDIQVYNNTDLDTRGDTGATTFDTIRLSGGESSSNTNVSEQWVIDDFYALDDSGSQNTTYLGPIKVEALFPSAEGTTINFTPSSGTDNSALVDENPRNDDTDYNSSSDTASNKDLFAADNLSNITGNIKAVQVSNIARVEEPGLPIGLQSIVAEGTPTQGTGSVVEVSETSTKYQLVRHIFETNPDTASAWIVSEVNGMEIGYEID